MAAVAFSWKAVPAAGPGAEAHCRRVAAIADELARRRGFDAATSHILRGMARRRRTGNALLTDAGFDRLMADLGLTAPGAGLPSRPPASANDIPQQARNALEETLLIANLIDESLEALPYYPTSFDRMIADLWALAVDGYIDPASAGNLAAVATPADLDRAIDGLPVFPAIALEVLRELGNREADLMRIERLAGRDQVLAASLLRAANSARYGGGRDVATLSGAIARIGTTLASQIVVAASLEPLFVSSALRDLWQHSMAVAAICSQLAARSGSTAADEAGVLGLVHDIGRLVIQRLPREHAAAHMRIAHASACPLVADYLVCGDDHGALGAGVLERWNFPAAIVEAVRYHHRPEQSESRPACALYVAEYLAGSEEDIPSISRLQHALQQAGVAADECLEIAAGIG